MLLPRLRGRADELRDVISGFAYGGFGPLHWLREPAHNGPRDQQMLHKILRELQDPDELGSDGMLAAVIAASSGRTEVINMLIAAAADVNGADRRGRTALAAASTSNHEDTARVLLHASADVNAGVAGFNAGRYGPHFVATSLWLVVDGAATANQQRLPSFQVREAITRPCGILRLLAEAGADPNWAPCSSERWRFVLPGTTPLHRAAESGAEELAQCLVEVRADPLMVDHWSRSPLLVAAENGHARVVACLISAGANLEQVDGWQRTPLWTAASRGFVNTVSTLLLARADVHAADNQGRTPIWTGSASGSAETVRALLHAHANLEAVDSWGATPLSAAAEFGRVKMVSALLLARAEVDRADNLGRTPLWLAAARDHVGVLFALLLAGADKEKASHSGTTPLLAACECPKGLRAAYALMSCGADMRKTDHQGRTAWQIACTRGCQEDFENVFAFLPFAGSTNQGSRGVPVWGSDMGFSDYAEDYLDHDDFGRQYDYSEGSYSEDGLDGYEAYDAEDGF